MLSNLILSNRTDKILIFPDTRTGSYKRRAVAICYGSVGVLVKGIWGEPT